MKKIGALILVCFILLLILSLFSGFNAITGQITKENIIISVSPQGEINTKSVRIDVLTSEKANCMYNLGLKDTVSFRFYNIMTVTGESRHSQLLKDLKNNDYTLSIKCNDKDNFAYTKDVDLSVKLSDECVRYCEYIDDCDEYASDGCDLTCIRDTDGINCGEEKICKSGFCIKKEEPISDINNVEEKPTSITEPIVAEKSEGLISKIVSFLRWIFR